jgi:hypothetical protein
MDGPPADAAPVLDARTVVLVEGLSDRVALEVLAGRHGRDLAAEGVAVVPMGGATNIHTFLGLYGPAGLDVTLAGLCDAREARDIRRGLERAGLTVPDAGAALERLGFFVCEADLEDELIRALGPDRAAGVVEAEGDLRSFRTLQKQGPWRDRPTDQQLRRFLGSGAGRKVRYARRLVEALDLDRVPRPLDRVLAQV